MRSSPAPLPAQAACRSARPSPPLSGDAQIEDVDDYISEWHAIRQRQGISLESSRLLDRGLAQAKARYRVVRDYPMFVTVGLFAAVLTLLAIVAAYVIAR